MLQFTVLRTTIVAGILTLAPAAVAQETLRPPDLISAYLGLTSYCDKGTYSEKIFTTERSESFERCALRDGRFKDTTIVNDSWRPFSIRWSDGETLFRHDGHFDAGAQQTTWYAEEPLAHEYSAPIGEISLVLILSRFLPRDRRLTSWNEVTRMLNLYSPNLTLSDSQYFILERRETHTLAGDVTTHRLWVSRQDGLIRKVEHLHPNSMTVVVLDSVDTATTPSREQLSHSAPLTTRYSLTKGNRPFVAIVAQCLLAATIGFVVWLAIGLTTAPGFIERVRPRLWKWYKLVVALLSVCLFVLALVALPLNGGHPPAIVGVYVVAVYAAIALLVAACFIGISYLTAPLVRYIRRRLSNATVNHHC